MELGLQNVIKNFAKHRVATNIDPLDLIALLEQEGVLNRSECQQVQNEPTIELRKVKLYLHILPNKYEGTVLILAQILENVSPPASDYLDDEYQKFKRWRRIISNCCDRQEFLQIDISKVVEKLDDKNLLDKSERRTLDALQDLVQKSKITILLETFASRTPKELKEILQTLEFIDQPSGLSSRFLRSQISENLSHKFEEYKIFHSHEHPRQHHDEQSQAQAQEPAESTAESAETLSPWRNAIDDPDTLQLFENHVEPNEIMPSLISFRVMDYNNFEEVRSKATRRDRLIALQMILTRRMDKETWAALVKSLRKNGYQNIVCEKLEITLQKYQ